jgi:[ribosomal protein S5]-alanine N-acetyltransferase
MRNVIVETERFVLRELEETDAEGIFELDSDPEVHKFLYDETLTNIQQCRDVIAFIRQQYSENGMGRWAIEEKATGRFLGWCGLKKITEPIHGKTGFLDLGYRIIRQFWGMGIATECAIASLEYGFHALGATEICAYTSMEHQASSHILQKCGFTFIETFYDDQIECKFFRITREEWNVLSIEKGQN